MPDEQGEHLPSTISTLIGGTIVTSAGVPGFLAGLAGASDPSIGRLPDLLDNVGLEFRAMDDRFSSDGRRDAGMGASGDDSSGAELSEASLLAASAGEIGSGSEVCVAS